MEQFFIIRDYFISKNLHTILILLLKHDYRKRKIVQCLLKNKVFKYLFIEIFKYIGFKATIVLHIF